MIVLKKFYPVMIVLLGLFCKPVLADQLTEEPCFSDPVEEANIKLVSEAYTKLIVNGDATDMDQYFVQDYIQHNPIAPNGLAGLINLFTNLRPDNYTAELGLVIAEGPFVAANTKNSGFFGVPQVGIDVYRIEDGLIKEHWDVLQAFVPADKTVSGNPMFPIPYTAQPSINEGLNKAIVMTALDQIFDKGNAAVVDYLFAEDYVEHAPDHASGRDAVTEFASTLPEDYQYELGFAMAYGDFVLTHSRTKASADEGANIRFDIFRVINGQISEHWATEQAEVPADQTVSGHAMFPVYDSSLTEE